MFAKLRDEIGELGDRLYDFKTNALALSEAHAELFKEEIAENTRYFMLGIFYVALAFVVSLVAIFLLSVSAVNFIVSRYEQITIIQAYLGVGLFWAIVGATIGVVGLRYLNVTRAYPSTALSLLRESYQCLLNKEMPHH